MKLTDKRLWWFEGIMLICGILSSYLYALNFGICISQSYYKKEKCGKI